MSDAPGLPPEVDFWRPPTLVATWFGIGLLPLAPGTWASISALPIAWTLHAAFGAWAVALAAVVVFAIGWWASENFVKRGYTSDPSYIVVDEVAGQLVALVPAALDPVFYAIAFIGFRVFDIMKPWPVGWADREVKGGLGVMLDDLLAGAYVAAILILATWLFSG